MKLALFDFDGTLTKKDSLKDFLHFYSGTLKFYFYSFLCLPILILYFFNLINASEAKQKILSFFLKGHNEAQLKQKGTEFIENLFHKSSFKKDVLQSLVKHISNNDHCYIISASPDLWIKPFAERMGVKYICTELKYAEGMYTGEFLSANCKGPEKAIRLLKEIELKDYLEITAYGNSKDDYEMMALAHYKNWVNI